jgi:hypothetical protein
VKCFMQLVTRSNGVHLVSCGNIDHGVTASAEARRHFSRPARVYCNEPRLEQGRKRARAGWLRGRHDPELARDRDPGAVAAGCDSASSPSGAEQSATRARCATLGTPVNLGHLVRVFNAHGGTLEINVRQCEQKDTSATQPTSVTRRMMPMKYRRGSAKRVLARPRALPGRLQS